MLYATKVAMCKGCEKSCDRKHIEEIYISDQNNELKEGSNYYTRESIHDYLKDNPESIQVKNRFGPYLEAYGAKGKYVRSRANDYTTDNLLYLPGGPYTVIN